MHFVHILDVFRASILLLYILQKYTLLISIAKSYQLCILLEASEHLLVAWVTLAMGGRLQKGQTAGWG